jgi:DNA-binding MarR family transcriptional regulator
VPGLNEINLDSRAELEIALPRLLILAGEVTARTGDLFIFGPFDLNIARYSLLMALANVPEPLSMTEIGQYVLRSPSNLTQLVDQLEQRGLVRRLPSPSDRRVNLLEITEAGRMLLTDVQGHFQKSMAESLRDQPTKKLRQLVMGLLEVIQGNMHALSTKSVSS